MTLIPLVGIHSYYATQAVHKLMFGLKMLPQYLGERYEAFFERLDGMAPDDQETMVREALAFVKLETDEILDLCRFCADANGIPYGEANLKAIRPEQLHEIQVLVAMEILKSHKVRLVSDTEKKN